MTEAPPVHSVHVRSRTRARRAVGLALVVLALLVVPSFVAGIGAMSSRPAGPIASSAAATVRTTSAVPVVRPADITDNYTCQEVNATICVSWGGTGYDVVPTFGNTTSNVLPDPNATLNFYIKSRYPLSWVGAPFGDSNETPIRINVTGVLWNGVPFMSVFDGTMWHANQGANYWAGPVGSVTNTSYPDWYTVTINGIGAMNAANFFPGEYVTWWMYIVAKSPQGHFSHFTSPQFHYRLAEAWAYSPNPGAIQYGGPNASSLDLEVSQTPLAPNWNDTVRVKIATTEADNLNRMLISTAVLVANETSSTGQPIASSVFDFNLTPGIGTAIASAIIPSTWAQYPGASVSYQILAWDDPGSKYTADEISVTGTPYTIGGNGTFLSGIFSDDLSLTATPASVAVGLLPGPVLDPNTTVTLLLTSRNPGTAIQAAEIDYVFDQPSIHTASTGVWQMSRINSTNFRFQVPSLPMGGFLNFTILAWDYVDTLEVSPYYGYSIASFNTLVPTVPASEGFLWVYVYDNGSHGWVNGATVAFVGAGHYVSITTHTMFGVAYPNASSEPSYPLLLTANVTYIVTIDDPWYVLPGAHSTQNVTYPIVLEHSMTYEGTLAQTGNYTVFENGNLLFFWLNSTGAGPSFSQSASIEPVVLAPAIGIIAASAAVFLTIYWWREVASRRREQERKVTL
jgi:hypothetical protein